MTDLRTVSVSEHSVHVQTHFTETWCQGCLASGTGYTWNRIDNRHCIRINKSCIEQRFQRCEGCGRIASRNRNQLGISDLIGIPFSKTVNGTLQPVKVGMFEIVVFFIKIRIVNSVGTGKIKYALGIICNEFRSDFHTYFMCSAQADDIGILFDIIHCLLIIIQRDEFLINQGTVHRIQFRKSSVCILRSGWNI